MQTKTKFFIKKIFFPRNFGSPKNQILVPRKAAYVVNFLITFSVDGSEETRYSGRHVERPARMFKGYTYSFNDLTAKDLRLSPNAMSFIANLLKFDLQE